MKDARSDSEKRTTGCTKPQSIMAGTASRQSAHGTNCTKRVSTAGRTPTDGGTKTVTAGTPNGIGTITTTTGGKLPLL